MATKYFVDQDGNYIGAFDGAQPPQGSIEVPEAPEHASQVWNFSSDRYGPINKSPDEELTETEQIRDVTEHLENIIDHLANGTPIPGSTISWAATRKGKRNA